MPEIFSEIMLSFVQELGYGGDCIDSRNEHKKAEVNVPSCLSLMVDYDKIHGRK